MEYKKRKKLIIMKFMIIIINNKIQMMAYTILNPKKSKIKNF